MSEPTRCPWCGDDPLYMRYHDEEWGKPLYDDARLFELLILEGMQAGLSWILILRKREAFRLALDGFDIDKILCYDQEKIASLLENKGIIRNRLKLNAVVINAAAFRQIQEEYGSFSDFLWGYVDNKPIENCWPATAEMPASTLLSDRISHDMKQRGFKFVGSTIIYSFMQAAGLVNDHIADCFLSVQNRGVTETV